MTVQLRTHSPAVVKMWLLEVGADQVWSAGEDEAEVDPITALCKTSMERDGKITTEPIRVIEGLNSCLFPEVCESRGGWRWVTAMGDAVLVSDGSMRTSLCVLCRTHTHSATERECGAEVTHYARP